MSHGRNEVKESMNSRVGCLETKSVDSGLMCQVTCILFLQVISEKNVFNHGSINQKVTAPIGNKTIFKMLRHEYFEV